MKYVDQYQHEDSEVVFHLGDPHLDTIRIPLPTVEEWYSKVLNREVSREEALTYVDGYGLPPHEQKFRHQQIPEKIKLLYEVVFEKLHAVQKSKYKDVTDVRLEDIYQELEDNQKYYAAEIEWIKRQIKRGYVGYWCFINGKPYYFTGRNYKFLNYWRVKKKGKADNRPDFRNYQREVFHVFGFFETTDLEFYRHKVIYRVDGKGGVKYTNKALDEIKRWAEEEGVVDWTVDFEVNAFRHSGKRTFHGVNFVSARRVAKTSSACAYCTFGTLEQPDQTFVIQAMNEDQAVDKIFVKQIQWPVNKLPFFFKPQTKGKEDGDSGFRFQYEGQMLMLEKAGLVPEAMECFIKPLSSLEKAATKTHQSPLRTAFE